MSTDMISLAEEIIGGRGEKVLTSVYKTEIQTNDYMY